MSTLKEQLANLSPEQRAKLEERLLGKALPTAEVRPRADDSPQPLSFAQESIWFFDQLLPGVPLYNMPQAFVLRGSLDPQALGQAFAAVIERHSALRTRFAAQHGVPTQQPWQPPQQSRVELPMIDLSALPAAKRDQELHRLLAQEAQRPFQLSQDLMIRACLIRLAPEEHVLLMSLHHIVADFSSLRIVYEDLSRAYAAPAPLPPDGPSPQWSFSHWAAEARQRAVSPAVERLLGSWKEHFGTQPAPLELPTDHPRTGSTLSQGARQMIHLPGPLTQALREMALEHSVTLHTLCLAAFQTLLHLYTQQEQIVVGSPMSTRDRPELERMVGLLLNTVVVRADFSGKPTFRHLLERVRAATVEALTYHEVPFERLLEAFPETREPGTNPLCRVMFQYLPSDWPVPHLTGLLTERLDVHTGTAKFELTLTLMEGADGLSGEMEYRSDLFETATIGRMLQHLELLLLAIVSQPDLPVRQLPILPAEEREKVLVEWNQTATDYPREACIQQLFEQQARSQPDAAALVFQDQTLSYSQLNREANQLARYLIGRGLKPRSTVALAVERSPAMIASLLAILKAGATYVPLDLQSPPERLAFILRDCRAAMLLGTDSLERVGASDLPQVHLDRDRAAIGCESGEDLPNPVTAEDLAYLIYTSGSTGQPKGVAIPHRGVVRLVKAAQYARFEPQDVFLQFAPLSFDASTFEIWGPLLNGAKLVLYPPEFQSLEQFVAVLAQYHVTTLWLTAGLFHQIVDEHLAGLKSVRQLLAGGDVLSVPHVLRTLRELPHCQLINGYGPTENTTFTCCYSFPRNWTGVTAPIGRPVSNTQVFILNPALAPVPIGVPGELYIGGDGLAREYVQSPELTRAKFIANPFGTVPTDRLYQTGDRARYLPDGTIEFLGRLDDQVKINGFRIHLCEIEAALQELPAVRQNVVVVSPGENGTKQLIAYVVLESGQTVRELRQGLAAQLPGYMIPAHFVVLPALPLTANGKVDRRSLPALAHSADSPATAPPPTLTPLHQQIIQVWKEVLARETIGLDDHFFELGGHSLLATRVVSRINKALQINLSIGSLFSAPTVRALAEKIATAPAELVPGPIKRRHRG